MLHPLVYPMFAMVVLTFLVALFMFYVRVSEIKNGRVKFSYFRTYVGDAPDLIIKTSRHFSNLFELPVIYYATVLLAIHMDLSSTAIYLFAWLFVVTRCLHTFFLFFVGNIYPRLLSYVTGWFAVCGLWITILSYN